MTGQVQVDVGGRRVISANGAVRGTLAPHTPAFQASLGKASGQRKVVTSWIGGIAALVFLAAAACGGRSETGTNAATQQSVAQPQATQTFQVRAPAVAGLFYPKDPQVLSTTVEQLLAAAPTNSLPNVKALVCPHAGYEYSGPVAACAYKTIVGRSFDTVIVLGPSHYATFRSVPVTAAKVYETPLGRAPISDKAKSLAKQSPFVLEQKCYVQRPGWASLAAKPMPPDGEDTPETWEHSVEVQIPFLQKTLKDVRILSLIFGDADPEKVAEALANVVDDKTLIVASSDLSHYHPYDIAKKMDQQTVKWICDMDFKSLQSSEAQESACGRMPVLVLMYLAKLKGWIPQLLDYRNSGDTSGNKTGGVVGYAAIAFVQRETQTTRAATPASTPAAVVPESNSALGRLDGSLSAEDRKFLLDLARKTLNSVTAGHNPLKPNTNDISIRLKQAKGCFVTLTENGELRGCIGNILPAEPLYEAVMGNARNAALRDPRFTPVTPDEVNRIHIEVSVLTEPEPLKFNSPDDLLGRLQQHEDGVILQIGPRVATFLPQVWEQLPDKAEFLDRLAQKAGCDRNAWRSNDVQVSTYHVEAFDESE